MRLVIQRVKWAKVDLDGVTRVTIGPGLLVLAGIARQDTERDADYMAGRIAQLRIFGDAAGKMNLSVADTGGEVLLVPNFTLYGDCGKGRRPDFDLAAPPEPARRLYGYLVESVRSRVGRVESGVFQAHMEVSLTNDGPVTLICDSP